LLQALPARLEPRQVAGRFEVIAAPLEEGSKLVLVRPAKPALEFLWRRDTLAVLGAFCLLSIALAGVVSRGVLRSERLALLGRLATGLAHEIHNPLSTIRLHSQLLESAAPDDLPEAVRQSAPILVDETGRIEALVNQWMFLARPEPPRTRSLSLAEVAQRVAKNYAALAQHAHVDLAVQIPAALQVEADERRLAQALSNLILNAIQAMPRGGRLGLTAKAERYGVRLTITDTGPGFSAAALTRWRDLFFSEKEGGMGVGLSVVAEIVEAHGGRVEIANELGGGASVRIDLPTPSSAPSP
jgi:signal transduction histidine kinase